MATVGTIDIRNDQKLGLGYYMGMNKQRPEGLHKRIRIAQQRHRCARCGALIEKGDEMAMRIGDFSFIAWPICLECDGTYPGWVKTEAQDNSMAGDGSALSGRTRHRPKLSVDLALILHLREVENLGWSMLAREYARRTGQDISTETCRRRYDEIRACKDIG